MLPCRGPAGTKHRSQVTGHRSQVTGHCFINTETTQTLNKYSIQFSLNNLFRPNVSLGVAFVKGLSSFSIGKTMTCDLCFVPAGARSQFFTIRASQPANNIYILTKKSFRSSILFKNYKGWWMANVRLWGKARLAFLFANPRHFDFFNSKCFKCELDAFRL